MESGNLESWSTVPARTLKWVGQSRQRNVSRPVTRFTRSEPHFVHATPFGQRMLSSSPRHDSSEP